MNTDVRRFLMILLIGVPLLSEAGWTGALAKGTMAVQPSNLTLVTGDVKGFHLTVQKQLIHGQAGFQRGYQRQFGRTVSVSVPAIFRIVSQVSIYNNGTNAAPALGFLFGRECGSKETLGYFPINPAVGDLAEGCSYPTLYHGVNNVHIMALVLRRGNVDAVLRLYLTPATLPDSVLNYLTQLANVVDRRIEIAHGGRTGGAPAGSSKPGLTVQRCKSRPCLFRAQGTGSSLFVNRWDLVPRSWRFSPGGFFHVNFQYRCNGINPNAPIFELLMVWNGGSQILREYSGQGAQHGIVATAPPVGITSVALLVAVQNTGCFWSIKAIRGPVVA
jgi:hypothetical protein